MYDLWNYRPELKNEGFRDLAKKYYLKQINTIDEKNGFCLEMPTPPAMTALSILIQIMPARRQKEELLQLIVERRILYVHMTGIYVLAYCQHQSI